MNCLLCGDICGCSENARPAAAPRWLADADAVLDAAPAFSVTEAPAKEAPAPSPLVEALGEPYPETSAPEDSTAWRQEVAARLNRYQARRKPRPPRYPSLRLRFEDQPNHVASGSAVESPAFPQRIVTASHQALALDRAEDYVLGEVETPASASFAPDDAQALQQTVALIHVTAPTKLPTTAKIIEFPRSWTPTPPPVDQLAEPVMDRPRILEAPEVVPPPPALGGITIEPALQSEFEKRPGIDIPLQSAPVGRRILSAIIDDVIIGLACFLFGFIFWKITALSPPRFQLVGITLGLSGLFWAAYQYLLLVYAGTTPGLRLARLQLSRFDGSATSRRTRRWRVLASYLSVVSLGMGYAWVFLDEDALCWHDRITHTYLAPRARRRPPGN